MKEMRQNHFPSNKHSDDDSFGPLQVLPSEEQLETENVNLARTSTMTVTSHPYSHPRSIPANIILPSLTSYQTFFDSQHTPNTESTSFHSTLFFQNWLHQDPSTNTNISATGQFFNDHQQTAFLTPHNFYYGSFGSHISPSYTSSFFDPNQVDVIMDDGSRQKRTVSLSTVPRFPSLTSIYSPRGGMTETTRLLASPYDSSLSQQMKPIDHFTSTTTRMDQEDFFSDSDDSFDEQHHGTKKKKKTSIKINILSWLKPPTLSTGQKLVLKCSFAYILGASFTFVPVLHQWINGGNYGEDNDGVVRNLVASDMAATVAVFFNPAKTVGGMMEAAGFGWIMTLGALGICLASLWSTDYFLDYLQQPYFSYGITLFGWLLTSTLFLAFLKARYSSRPSVGTASSLAFIILFPILLREHALEESLDSRQKIQDTVAIVAIGTAISAAVCFFIWPQTATKKFNSNMYDSLQSLRVLLKLLTKTFLLDADLPDFKANKPLAQAIRVHDSSFTALQSSLQEARLEWWWWCPLDDDDDDNNNNSNKEGDGYERMVKSIQQLALHIGGLRKSCGLQFDRIQHTMATTSSSPSSSSSSATKNDNDNDIYQVRADDHRRKFERTLKREHTTRDAEHNNSGNDSEPTMQHHFNNNNGDLVSFIRTVGPTMKSLAFTCKQTIIHLQWHFTPASSTKVSTTPPPFATLRRNLGLALDLFEQSQQKALQRMCRQYAKNDNNKHTTDTQSNGRFPYDVHNSALSHLPADDVFLVYFFVYCLIAFAKELEVLVTCMEYVFGQTENANLWTSLVSGIKRFFTHTFKSNRKSTYHPNNNHTLDTLHTPTPNDRIHSFRMNLWYFFSWFRRYQVRYAIKAGITALVLASMSFIPSTRYYFQTYHMEWTLITALAVMTPTVGGTNYIAMLQLGATVFGVVIGALVYRFFSESHVIWFIGLTWLLSLPCFWMVLHEPKHGKFGQFTLLAYTLVILYKYNHPDVNIYDLAYQRCLSVGGGVIIGLVVTKYISPYEARKQVRYGLSDLLINFSRKYYALNSNKNGDGNKNIAMVSVTIGNQPLHDDDDYVTTLLDLQQDLCNLSTLLSHAPNEPRLKGRFPIKTYQMMLQSCQSILDNLLMMRMVVAVGVHGHRMKNDENWTEMVGNVVLYFYVLASALQLKTPLPPYLPPADMARKQLMVRLQATTTTTITPASTSGTITTQLHDASSSSTYMAYYAYIILMETMLSDMDQLGYHMRALYGSLIPHWHH